MRRSCSRRRRDPRPGRLAQRRPSSAWLLRGHGRARWRRARLAAAARSGPRARGRDRGGPQALGARRGAPPPGRSRRRGRARAAGLLPMAVAAPASQPGGLATLAEAPASPRATPTDALATNRVMRCRAARRRWGRRWRLVPRPLPRASTRAEALHATGAHDAGASPRSPTRACACSRSPTAILDPAHRPSFLTKHPRERPRRSRWPASGSASRPQPRSASAAAAPAPTRGTP